ncbi:DUF317 domain-containing protein [Kitasatospora sp. NPDC004669]|uniref:DUF317 domain-containing protein n=1 Tax=Kitasatospora sp. NPDC004669 TaxID=3154555 RepID=UPI0033BC147B
MSPSGNLIAWSPCHRISVLHLVDRDPAWQVVAARDPFGPPDWRGAFGENTPPEIVAGFFGSLAQSLDYDTRSDGWATFVSLEGSLADAVETLADSAWLGHSDGAGQLVMRSPDGEAMFTAGPLVDPAKEMLDGPTRFAWAAGGADPQIGWTAHFSSCTPLHLVACLNAEVSSPQGAVRKTDLLPQRIRDAVKTAHPLPEQAAKPQLPAAASLLALDEGLEKTMVAVRPLYLAGPGEPGLATAALTTAAGWSRASSPTGQVWDSPCQTVRVAHLNEGGGGWRISATRDPLGPARWSTAFSEGTPTEIIGAVTTATALALAGPGLEAAWREPFALPGGPGSVLEERGWSVETLAERTFVNAPDGHAHLQSHVFDFDDYEELEGHTPPMWTLAAQTRHTAWTATFTSRTPLYLVTAAAETMSSPAAVPRAERSLPREQRAHLDVAPLRGPSSRAEAARARGATATGSLAADTTPTASPEPGGTRPRR